ncbi:MAG: DUF6144 family protein [Candidatus Cloacimonadales bacterium]|jgi:hypothetical protein|nr:DUF6144 family protein [Candidatus Cloacimonadota bacterium]MDX9978351.1 DUF6144 family protein [Candidatus Cloacimonadales bacterium]
MSYSNLLPYLKKLARHLDDTVGEDKRKEILDGCESITAKSGKVLRSHIMRDVMLRMEDEMDRDEAVSVREKCSCKPKYQVKPIKELYEHSADIQSFIERLNDMDSVGSYRLEDNIIHGSFNHKKCVCHMVTSTKEPMPKLWCDCCKGYVKWLFSNVFSMPIEVEMLDTIITGSDNCYFKIYLPCEKQGN